MRQGSVSLATHCKKMSSHFRKLNEVTRTWSMEPGASRPGLCRPRPFFIVRLTSNDSFVSPRLYEVVSGPRRDVQVTPLLQTSTKAKSCAGPCLRFVACHIIVGVEHEDLLTRVPTNAAFGRLSMPPTHIIKLTQDGASSLVARWRSFHDIHGTFTDKTHDFDQWEAQLRAANSHLSRQLSMQQEPF